MRLKDKVAIVTGAASGIGREIAVIFAREGAKVAFLYKGSQKAAEELEKEITAAGGVAKAIQGDVSDPETAKRVVAGVLADWGRVDILVNNAGVIRDGLFLRMEPDAWKTVLSTNLDPPKLVPAIRGPEPPDIFLFNRENDSFGDLVSSFLERQEKLENEKLFENKPPLGP